MPLPFLSVDEGVARRLEAGELGIVLDPNVAYPRYVIVPRDVALKLEERVAESICMLAGRD